MTSDVSLEETRAQGTGHHVLTDGGVLRALPLPLHCHGRSWLTAQWPLAEDQGPEPWGLPPLPQGPVYLSPHGGVTTATRTGPGCHNRFYGHCREGHGSDTAGEREGSRALVPRGSGGFLGVVALSREAEGWCSCVLLSARHLSLACTARGSVVLCGGAVSHPLFLLLGAHVAPDVGPGDVLGPPDGDRKSTRLNSSH